MGSTSLKSLGRTDQALNLGLIISRGLDVTQGRNEITKNFGRNHDRIPVSIHILGDFHYHAARVALEV